MWHEEFLPLIYRFFTVFFPTPRHISGPLSMVRLDQQIL